jgi:hypothetical protein
VEEEGVNSSTSLPIASTAFTTFSAASLSSQHPYMDFLLHFGSRTLLMVNFLLLGMSVANNPFKAKIPFFPSVENSIE